MHGLDLYDYGSRMHHSAISRWGTMDPLAEKYYYISPYAYCAGNPVRFIDIKGEYIANAKGNKIYKNGKWSKSAPVFSIRIGKAMQSTPIGKEYFDFLVNASYPVTLNLITGTNENANADINIKEKTTIVNGKITSHKIVCVDINISEGNAVETLKELNKLKAGKISISNQSDSDKARADYMPQTVDDIIGQKATHEVGHLRQPTKINKSE